MQQHCTQHPAGGKRFPCSAGTTPADFPQSMFWAHPGCGAFCKFLVSEAWRTGWLCWPILGYSALGRRELSKLTEVLFAGFVNERKDLKIQISGVLCID